MTLRRIMMFAAVGVTIGLLLENKALLLQQSLQIKARRLRRQTRKMLEKHQHPCQAAN